MRAATSKPAAVPALLVLEDGAVFAGTSCGAPGEAFGEICFNTSLESYLEIVTDPSYAGQIVALTYPQVGNYGVNADDAQAERPALRALVVRDLCPTPSSWRSQESLGDYLTREGVVAIEGIDTRAARAPHPRPWRPAGRRFHHGRGCRLAAREGAPKPVASRREPGRRRVLRRRLLLHRREPARFPWLRPGRPGRAPLQGGRLPLRREALHLRRSGGEWLRAHRRALGHSGRRGAGDGPRRRVPLQRPGRPGGGGGDLSPGREAAGPRAAVRASAWGTR